MPLSFRFKGRDEIARGFAKAKQRNGTNKSNLSFCSFTIRSEDSGQVLNIRFFCRGQLQAWAESDFLFCEINFAQIFRKSRVRQNGSSEGRKWFHQSADIAEIRGTSRILATSPFSVKLDGFWRNLSSFYQKFWRKETQLSSANYAKSRLISLSGIYGGSVIRQVQKHGVWGFFFSKKQLWKFRSCLGS